MTYIDVIREFSGGNSTLIDEGKRELTQRMEEFLPGAGLSSLLRKVPILWQLNWQQIDKEFRR